MVRTSKAQADTSTVLKAKKKTEGVLIGMTIEDALESSWSTPKTINKTTNAYGVREQWVLTVMSPQPRVNFGRVNFTP